MIPVFIIFFAIVAFLWKVPDWVAGFYLGASVVCFVVYAMDKSAAVGNHWRISEDNSLGLGPIGGWPGASVAQLEDADKAVDVRLDADRDTVWLT